MRKVIITAVYGEECEKTFAITSPNLSRYAAKIGASLFVMRDRSGLGDGPHWEKCRIADYLRDGCTVIWIDADAIISPWCSDLTQLFPRALGEIAACDEVISGYWKHQHSGLRALVPKMAEAMGRRFQFSTGDTAYYNTGVMVVHPTASTVAAFTLNESAVVSDCVWEQSWLNLKFREAGCQMIHLPRAFNEMQFFGDVVHAAGLKWPQKNTRLAEAAAWMSQAPIAPPWLGQYS